MFKIALGFCLLFFSPFLFAEETESLAPVLVQGSTPSVAGFDPQTVLVLEGSNRDRFQSVDEALREVPGLSVVSSGGVGQQSAVFIRGSNSEHTLVLVDGIELNDPSNPSGAFDFSTWDLNLIERIEVYRGPSSLRFGSGALGGVINIVTKSGKGPSGSSLFLRGGSDETSQLGLGFTKSNEKLRLQGSFNRFESGGFSAADESQGFSEQDGHRSFSGAIKAGAALSPDWDLELLLRASRANTELDYTASSVPPFYISADDPNSSVETRQTLLALTAQQKWSSTASSNWKASRTWLGRDYDDPPDALNTLDSSNRYRSQTSKLENRTQLELGPEWKANTGLVWREESAASNYLSSLFQNDFPTATARNTGAFFEGVFRRGRAAASIGFRQDFHSEFGPATTWALAPGVHFPELEAWLSLQVASAFKAPSLYQLHSAGTGNRDLKPERAIGLELSWKQSLSEQLLLSMTFFENRYQDLIQFGSRYENAGRARVPGVELGLQGSSDFSVYEAALLWMDPRNLETGKRLLRRPRVSWNLSVERQLSDSVSAQLVARGSGERADRGAVSSQPETSSGFEVIDLSLNQKFRKNLQVGFQLQNLLDRSYQEISGYGRPRRSFLLSLSIQNE